MALVITIIVLIILATVSVNIVLGDDGIISRAETAIDLYENSSAAEEEDLQKLLNQYELALEDNTDVVYETDIIVVDLVDGMIPVVYDDDLEGWVEVDQTADDWESDWYDYSTSSKQWANCILAVNGNEDSLFDSDTGVLNESQDYVQLVYIPRYAYRITSGYHTSGEDLDGGAGTIEIVFIDEDNVSTNGVEYSTEYPSVTDDSMDDYVVHPAFDFGDTHLAGFWVGKFESSNTDCDSYYNADGSINEDFDVTTGQADYTGTEVMTVKSNVTSWRYISISNTFDVCLSIDNSGNVYGLIEGETDSHLMKNTEWGAVAYLTQSSYGKNSEVWNNSNTSYITGMAGSSVDAASESDTSAYNTSTGVNASTTGNIYGIYDMSGGSWESVASYVDVGSASTYFTSNTYGYSVYQAGQSSSTLKYVNVYEASSEDSSDRELNYALALPSSGYYGDAVYETSAGSYPTYSNSSWYSDYSYFPNSRYPFFARGGYYPDTTTAGVFVFGHWTAGGAGSHDGFRVVVPVL